MKNYVPTTLDQYLNESKSITLKRGYGGKPPVVVSSNAPIRNQILSFVAESEKVSGMDLKRFIAGLNETNANPVAAANMWLRRNERFFIKESKEGRTFYKLSKLGERLVSRFIPTKETNLSEDVNLYINTKKVEEEEFEDELGRLEDRELELELEKDKKFEDEILKPRDVDKEEFDFIDTRKGYARPGIYSSDECAECEDREEIEEFGEEQLDESKKERILEIIKNIKTKRNKKLNEAKDNQAADELSFDDIDVEDEDKKEEVEGEEKPKEELEEVPTEEEEKVEITDFIITVDDAGKAIAELAELGIEAEKHEELEEEPEEEILPETPEEAEAPEETAELEAPEEAVEEAAEEVETPEEKPEEDLDLEAPEEDLDLEAPEEAPEEEPKGEEIKVSADNWEALKGWLEEKGVDIEEMFGGEIEMEEIPGAEEDLEFPEEIEDEEKPEEKEEEESLDLNLEAE